MSPESYLISISKIYRQPERIFFLPGYFLRATSACISPVLESAENYANMNCVKFYVASVMNVQVDAVLTVLMWDNWRVAIVGYPWLYFPSHPESHAGKKKNPANIFP